MRTLQEQNTLVKEQNYILDQRFYQLLSDKEGTADVKQKAAEPVVGELGFRRVAFKEMIERYGE